MNRSSSENWKSVHSTPEVSMPRNPTCVLMNEVCSDSTLVATHACTCTRPPTRTGMEPGLSMLYKLTWPLGDAMPNTTPCEGAHHDKRNSIRFPTGRVPSGRSSRRCNQTPLSPRLSARPPNASDSNHEYARTRTRTGVGVSYFKSHTANLLSAAVVRKVSEHGLMMMDVIL